MEANNKGVDTMTAGGPASSLDRCNRRRRRNRPARRNIHTVGSKDTGFLLFVVVASILLIRASESFRLFHSTTTYRPQERFRKTTISVPFPGPCYSDDPEIRKGTEQDPSPRARRFIVARFAEPRTEFLQAEAGGTETAVASSSSDSNSSSSSVSSNLDELYFATVVDDTNAATNKTDSTTSVLASDDEANENLVAGTTEGGGLVTRRDVFRYGTILAGAVGATYFAFATTDDPSSSKTKSSSRRETTKTTKIAPPRSASPPAAVPATTTSPRLEPVNLTEVASQTNVNVTINCEKTCVSIDSSNFTFNKVERPKTPDWLPPILRPKSQIVKKIPNSELLVAATAAGSVIEIARTSLLYPLQTVKIRLQVDRNTEHSTTTRPVSFSSLSEQLETLGKKIRQKIDEGDLYAGISPTLLVSVPATGIYFGVRDVTKRLLFRMTSLDPLWIAVGGALVGDIVSLCFRVPSDALAIRLQTQNSTTNESGDSSMGDWLGDSIQRIPMIILTDLPYLLSKIVLNKALVQGTMSVSEYAVFAAIASIVAGFLTTPFDVARTRILLDEWSDDDEEATIDNNEENVVSSEESKAKRSSNKNNAGNSVLRTMIRITEEGEGGFANLFSGWLERVLYLGIGRAWLEPIQLIGYIGIRDAVLLEWF